ncbi:YsnF/AvaK domain-containing protein [Falsiroseomonas ponticola]|uniref:YsnF/AvaK domain-containing protein n=1 Tax=Falsiroseomonas ponticola TaxID=2786951 RepID=UPI0019311863|nr:YsnF/AvaK domain-containing protein [Roseomonas ponticola]
MDDPAHKAGPALPQNGDAMRLPLLAEVPRLRRRRRVTALLRVAVTTTAEAQEIAWQRLVREAAVERVPIDREVASPPPTRREGDVLVIPVVEERVTVTRRLVVTEELRIRLRERQEAESVSLTLRRQAARVERLPPPVPDDATNDHNTGETLMDRTITAMFDSRAEADQAAGQLRQLGAQNVQVRAASGSATSGPSTEEDRGILAAIADLFVPDDDRRTYGEGLRRGHVVVSAEVAEGLLDRAMDMLEAGGAVDLDTREEEWRGAGWLGGSAAGAGASGGSAAGSSSGSAAGSSSGSAAGGTSLSGTTPLSGGLAAQADTSGAAADPRRRGANLGSAGAGMEAGEGPGMGAGMGAGMGSTTGTPASAGAMARTDQDGATALPGGAEEERVKLAEERLRVGKREAHAGRVRVRSYVVETPVEEQVRLREERVHVEQRPLDRPATAEEAGLFQDRTIEAEESVEEAVVGKEVRVTGEVVVSKDATEHTETIRDTVRRTEVDVDQDSAANDPRRRPGRGAA